MTIYRENTPPPPEPPPKRYITLPQATIEMLNEMALDEAFKRRFRLPKFSIIQLLKEYI